MTLLHPAVVPSCTNMTATFSYTSYFGTAMWVNWLTILSLALNFLLMLLCLWSLHFLIFDGTNVAVGNSLRCCNAQVIRGPWLNAALEKKDG